MISLKKLSRSCCTSLLNLVFMKVSVLLFNIEVDISFQNLPNFWMAKARVSTYILFSISNFKPALYKNSSIYGAQIPWDIHTFCSFNIFGNEANI